MMPSAHPTGLPFGVTGAYPVICAFPGCDRRAPLGGAFGDSHYSLCFQHDELRFYDPVEFARLWAEHDPAGSPGA
jgi:hypothetical protein